MKKLKFLYKLTIFFMITFTVIISCLYTYAYFSPKITLNSANALSLYDNENNLILQTSNNKKWANINEISNDLLNATISVEDKNFYHHFGFDYLRILKSLYLNAKTKSITAGASTISQQYVKNLFLDFDQTWKRKIKEAMLTLNLEVHYSKKEILEGYLNTINYGQGNFGIENASNYYFNKKSSELTLEEAIILAGIPKSPENYNPVNNYDASIKRAKIVAEAMYKNKKIDEETYKNLFSQKIEIYGQRKTNNMQTLMYYYDAVLNELNSISNIPKDLIKSKGLKVYTNLDINAQQKLDNTFKENENQDNIELAAIMAEPSTGKVFALAGGLNYSKSQFNRAIFAKRQVGSTIKPFLYYAALNNNMTEASTFKSEETSFVFAENKKYTPKNYSNIYADKNITMAAALAYSDNIYAVKTHLFIGTEELVNTLKEAGLKKEINTFPALALGAVELNLLDYVETYNTLANYGTYKDLYFIEKVEDYEGNLIYKHKSETKDVLNKDNVFIINEMLTNTYNASFIDYQSPTIISLNSRLTKKYAIKSGTTDNDYLVIGYNPDVLMFVWAGSDYNGAVPKAYSSKIKNIWCDNVEEYLKDKESSWYTPSDNIIAVPLDPISGKVAESSKNILYYFKRGTEPITN